MNVVFSLNQADTDGGGLWNSFSRMTVSNSIIWDNRALPGADVFNLDDNAITFSYSILSGGLPEDATDAGGNLFSDPLFVDADGPDAVPGTLDDDLRLQMNSPAIDAGDNTALPADSLDLDSDGDLAEPLPIDLDNHQRIVDGGSGRAVVDMGAYEFGALPVHVAVEVPDPEIGEPLVSWTVYPNPFRDQTTLRFSLRRSGPVQVVLYDVLGRRVEHLYEGVPAAGPMHTLRIDGKRLPAGVYVVRLLGEDLDTTQTILLLR